MNRTPQRRLSGKAGQVFTIEFAMAAIGIVAIAWVVARVGAWGLGWIAASSQGFNSTRVAAATDGGGAGAAAPGPGGNLNLIGGGPESLGSFNSKVGRGSFGGNDCSAGFDAAMTDRLDAQKLITNAQNNALPDLVKNAKLAKTYYGEANRLRARMEELEDEMEALEDDIDGWECEEPPPEIPPCDGTGPC